MSGAAGPDPERSAHAPAKAAPPPVAPRQVGGVQRVLLRTLAVVSLGLAFVGVVTPGLPTTEFVLLATWAAARSSPRLHAWIVNHRLFGPLLAHWQAGKLPRRAKWAATASMTLAGVIAALTIPHRLSVLLIIGSMSCVLVWLWFRPEP
ncbi:YbaN family protein [Stenotrophomonas maltophilia]